MLSRQYRPSEYDGVDVEEERVVPIRRNKSSFYSNPGPQLTIHDLQKLDELAEEASKSDDPSKLRSMLRRSLSLNMSPSLIDQMDDIPDVDEADAPIIVPRPGQILRRAARTKIRKPNLQGDGGGHRFPSTRRGGARANTIATSDVSSSEHDHEEPFSRPQAPTNELHDDPEARPTSFTDEAFIFDAYADRRDSLTSSESNEPSSEDSRDRYSLSPPPVSTPIPRSTSPTEEPKLLSQSSPPSLYHPMPQRKLSVPSSSDLISPSRTPSPAHSDPGPTTEILSPSSSAVSTPATEVPPTIHETSPAPQMRSHHPPSPSPSRKEKEKKGGLFGGWGAKGDKKKGSKADVGREKEVREREKEKEKDSGFFGSLFGGKKKQDESASAHGSSHGGPGPATPLGASKSGKSYVPSPSPQLAGAYARYPIHVERAVYRLSHIKLANPRRPLYEQVLISNLMFWYLGVINKAQNGGTTPTAAGTNGAPGQGQDQQQQEKEQREREQREREQRERTERERQERERAEQVKRESGRKGSLNKAHRSGSEGGGSRRAEMPVRGPQYESQHRAMEHEYSYGAPSNQGGSSSQPIRTGSAPPAPMAGAPGYHNYNNHRMSPQPMMQGMSGSPPGQHSIQQAMQPGQYYYNPMPDGHNPTAQPNGPGPYNLPPGAMMPPMAMEQTWLASAGSGQPAPSSHSPTATYSAYNTPPHGQNEHSAPPRRTRSPPPNHLSNQGHPKHPTTTPPGARLQGRSLSATAVPPQHSLEQGQNGKLKKKPASANAVPLRRRSSDGVGTFGEEDLPLAVWQQQQRAGGRR